ncbi:MAG: class IV adenylate cyclase [Pirellulaceae bacterium]|nr:class IV adenylate cyclase [Pirellulaceae bacterium]MDP6555579.1 class IV adenylate cyclase [Pirellulaceae bacterium]
MYEVEQKYRVDDLAAVQERLCALGAAWDDEVQQVDRYFAHPCRNFSETDEALRIRQVGEENFVTYKGPKIDRTTKTRRELELPLPTGLAFATEFAQLLTLLGFEFVAEVCKVRRKAAVTWQDGSIEVAIDRVERVGDYVELEVMATMAELEIAKERLTGLARELHLEDVERRSYLELLLGSSTPE